MNKVNRGHWFIMNVDFPISKKNKLEHLISQNLEILENFIE